jgi:hypothetical protein
LLEAPPVFAVSEIVPEEAVALTKVPAVITPAKLVAIVLGVSFWPKACWYGVPLIDTVHVPES